MSLTARQRKTPHLLSRDFGINSNYASHQHDTLVAAPLSPAKHGEISINSARNNARCSQPKTFNNFTQQIRAVQASRLRRELTAPVLKIMGCENCSNGSGTPNGCKNNGTCSNGGCNKLAVFDWLANMELPSGIRPFDCIEVRFKNSRKNFYRNNSNIPLAVGEVVAVEGSPGYDIGVVAATGELARLQMNKKQVNFDSSEIRKVYRKAEEGDLEKWHEARKREHDLMLRTREMAAGLGLTMKISDVEFQGDASKATFFYTAEERVDFRQLIKVMADEFKIRIEMRQIGARQEAALLGGIGSCGRELCCSTWLTDFRSVSTSSARYQQLSLNPQKLAGQCGKLKCCLNYELDMYLEAFREFPGPNTRLETEKGRASCIKIDIFKRTLWFVYEDEMVKTPIPLGLDKVNRILEMNTAGKKPHDLKDYMEIFEDDEPDYTNVVGQDSLSRFDHLKTKKKKRKKKRPGQGQGQQQGGGQKQQGRRKKPSGQQGQKGGGKPKQGQGGKKPQGQRKGGDQQKGKGPQAQKGNQQRRKKNNSRRGNKPRPQGGGNKEG